MEKMVCITRVFTFDSAHMLKEHDGKCKFLHGHTYKLEVTIKGNINKNGMVIDFKELKIMVKENVVDYVDHRYLNELFDFNPTCEMIILWIWEKLKDKIKVMGCYLEKIVLWETPTCFATLERDKVEI